MTTLKLHSLDQGSVSACDVCLDGSNVDGGECECSFEDSQIGGCPDLKVTTQNVGFDCARDRKMNLKRHFSF